MLAEEGKAKAVAFDEIDKAPEEKARGITIATVRTGFLSFCFVRFYLEQDEKFSVFIYFTYDCAGPC